MCICAMAGTVLLRLPPYPLIIVLVEVADVDCGELAWDKLPDGCQRQNVASVATTDVGFTRTWI